MCPPHSSATAPLGASEQCLPFWASISFPVKWIMLTSYTCDLREMMLAKGSGQGQVSSKCLTNVLYYHQYHDCWVIANVGWKKILRGQGASCRGCSASWAPHNPHHCPPTLPTAPQPAHDAAQLLQVGRSEVPVVAVTPLHVLLDAVQVHRVLVQPLRLQAPSREGKKSHPSSAETLPSRDRPSPKPSPVIFYLDHSGDGLYFCCFLRKPLLLHVMKILFFPFDKTKQPYEVR